MRISLIIPLSVIFLKNKSNHHIPVDDRAKPQPDGAASTHFQGGPINLPVTASPCAPNPKQSKCSLVLRQQVYDAGNLSPYLACAIVCPWLASRTHPLKSTRTSYPLCSLLQILQGYCLCANLPCTHDPVLDCRAENPLTVNERNWLFWRSETAK